MAMTTEDHASTATVSMDHVTKLYRGGGGVIDLSLSIEPGEIFGFLGPNGAGKTTTIRLILDFIRPSVGSIKVFGLDARTQSVAIHRRVGYIPGELALYDHLTGREILSHFAYLRGGLSWAAVESRAGEFDLDLDRPVRALSRGNRQKVGLVAALMGEPELLLLDEPTSGLDPLVQQQVQQTIRKAALNGCTVFLSSHALSEVGEIAGRVGLIREGRLVAVERVVDLQQRSVHLVDAAFSTVPDQAQFAALAGVTKCELAGNSLHLEVTGDLNPLVATLARMDLTNLSIREPSLEELFLTFYGQVHGQ
jgi:ABC-2 type transport system ATP-binding protein